MFGKMDCLICDGKGYYYKDGYLPHYCTCENNKLKSITSKVRKIYDEEPEVDESHYVMDATMIMSITTLFLEMQDYDSMMEYASLLHGVDLGN